MLNTKQSGTLNNNTTKEIKMTYPYIGNSTSKTTGSILFYSYKSGVRLEDIPGHKKGFYCETWNESLFANITHEYLRNTYGKVESKEHAEFIVKLAESAGFKLISAGVSMSSVNSFMIYGDDKAISVYTMKVEHLSNDAGYKLITIPLPPKESEEWPKVGDEVLIDSGEHLSKLENFNGEKCKVIGICDHKGEKVLTLSHGSLGVAALIMGDWIKKPPTPEEELSKELEEMFYSAMNESYDENQNCKYLVSGLMKMYDIKKKPD